MNIRFFLVPLLMATGAAAQNAVPAVPKPADFTNHADIALGGPGPYHRVALPLVVYQGVQRADLGDLRVFNGKGEPVPHALLRSGSTVTQRTNEMPMPLFPIMARADRQGIDGDLALDVRRNADGTLISLRQSQPADPGTLVRGVIVDASQAGRGLRFLRLKVGPAATPFHAFTIETSDDLLQWRMLKSDAQLVQLEHDGRRIEKNTAQWGSDAGKYLRIVWRDPAQAPAIQEVAVGLVSTEVEQPETVWSSPLVPVKSEANAFEYALPGHMPLERLRIELPEQNMLSPVTVLRPTVFRVHQREERRWQPIANAVVYRLQSPQGEIRSPDIVLGMPGESSLRLSFDGRSGTFGSTPPRLQVGFVPQELVFLARGNGPFSLAWGASGVHGAALPIATLVPNYVDDKQLSASPASLRIVGTPAVAQAAAAAPAQALSKYALWAILVGGVIALAAMVLGLLRQMRRQNGQ
jgi:hypothetical protein